MDNTKKLTHISLCSGYAGMDIGLKKAGLPLRTITYVEIEAFACQNLVAKMENGWLDPAPIWTNLKTFDWKLFSGRVDILSGGFPCQPFSQVGKRKASEDPRHLWPYIVKGIKELGKPPILFFENVEGIISAKLKSDEWSDPQGTPVLQHVLRELERLGYTAKAGIFSASEVGSAHKRRRVFILGINNSLSKSTEAYLRSSMHYIQNHPRPNLRDLKQYSWEPPRTLMDYSNSKRLSRDKDVETDQTPSQREKKTRHITSTSAPSRELQREFKYSLGGNTNGTSDRLDLSRLYTDFTNSKDELKLLGNGVVPDVAAKAFYTLFQQR